MANVSDGTIVLMLVFTVVASLVGLGLAIWIEKGNKGIA